MSVMSGKEVRMRRIFKEDGKTVISALDMGLFGGTTPGLEDVRAITKKVVDAGADAVMTMCFVGGESNPAEQEQIKLMKEVRWECHKYGMPFFPELLHCNWADQSDVDWIDACARAGFEYGADAVKVLCSSKDFDKVVAHCPVPVVMAGGPKSASLEDVLQYAMDSGAAGCAIGRNVYGSDDPAARIKALRKIVHGEE